MLYCSISGFYHLLYIENLQNKGDIQIFLILVQQLRERSHLLVLLEYSLLHNRLPTGSLEQRSQKSLQKKAMIPVILY
jgi:hypothetical protein